MYICVLTRPRPKADQAVARFVEPCRLGPQLLLGLSALTRHTRNQNIDKSIRARNPLGLIIGFGKSEHGIEQIERENITVNVAVFDSASDQLICGLDDLR
jgi:hypothetical protein